ncbi:predicted protein [Uncinocarpus reesii 1704]|uniref:Uncharacterized protein n=1 Tax=Uncinocarpus reesii (strain UAMH 1704) TaxID=336963 RepID=C4JVV7_UNCRE|nr:uncharacterized protein UREG_06699 [Uncinocarpus reesii 1704]EEP81834.1 predicted protein [Uncinocarpus reesii 1704]
MSTVKPADPTSERCHEAYAREVSPTTAKSRCDTQDSRSPSRTQPPAALSIYQLARLHCRERLIVYPLLWTDRHVGLLQCSFEHPSIAPPRSWPHTIQKMPGAYSIKSLFKDDDDDWGQRDVIIEDVLAGFECPLTIIHGNDLYFFFDRRRITLPCLLFFPQGSDYDDMLSGRVPAVVACTDCARIQDLRYQKVSSCGGRRYSKSTSALIDLKLKKLTPSNPLQDPYILALLIALAQQQRSALQQTCPKEQDIRPTFSSQVLLIDPSDKANIHLFTADISSSFLDKFKFPSIPPSTSPSLLVSVRHMMVPYKPSETFRSRIFPLLLPGRLKHG